MREELTKKSTLAYDSLKKLQDSLPLLPGVEFNLKNHVLPNFRKSHAFDYCNQVSVFKPETPGIGGLALDGQEESKIHTSVEIYPKSDSNSEKVPSYVAFDRKVLRFYGYFQEAVNERREETYRVRRVNIYFYLEDDTIHVSEPRLVNSGIPQGTLIRRHRIPKPEHENGQHYLVSDFNVGKEITFYGKTFKITGCDKFTREFLTELNIAVPNNTTAPADPFETQRKELISRMKPLKPKFNPVPQNLKQFLENDRRVLRFYCVWDDTNSCFGDIRHMVVHYFLSDDSIEIKESIPPNSGRAGNTLFLRRCKLPKRFYKKDLQSPQDYYNESDFIIGSVIHLYGRPFVICDCDEFTKNYYKEMYGLENFDPVAFDERDQEQEQEKEDQQKLLPFFANLHKDQDEFYSPSSLIPNIITHTTVAQPAVQIKKKVVDFNRLLEFDGIHLRYAAVLISTKKIDQGRSFIISLYPSDDSISAFEPRQRNSGILGGKFMEKNKILKPNGSSEYYSTADFHIGAEIELHGHKFKITGADEFAIKFMSKYPHLFPKHQ